jgi:hypothetical protein
MWRSALLLGWLCMLPVMAAAAPAAPQTLVIIGCRVDDHTGEPGRQDPALAARGWKDLEWHFEDAELECKREVVPLEDAVAMMDPSVRSLAADFSSTSQCAHAGAFFMPTWEQANQGWAVMAIGCPVRIETDGRLTGWKLPDCPSSIGGLSIKCRFDGSNV